MLRTGVMAGWLAAVPCLGFSQGEDKFNFDIPQQSVQRALLELAQQAQLPILLPMNAFSNLEANALRGEYSVAEALALLLEGTDVRAQFDQSGQLIVEKITNTNIENNPRGDEGMPENRTRRNILAAAIASIFSGGAETAVSQEAVDEAALEEITVTGSRITQVSGFATPVPVTTLSTDELRDMQPGSTISAQLDVLPQFFATRTLQNSGSGNTGSAVVGSPTPGLNLRNLENKRTLVLLDGSRVVPTDKQGLVNVDAFPSALMRTVDVVTGGASATYGADAVGGVVNFVLDRQFEGLEMSAGFGQNEGGVGRNRQFSVAGGKGFLDNRLHLIGSLQSQEVDEISADWTRHDNFQFWGSVRNPEWAAWRAENPTAPAASAPVPLRITRPWVTSATSSPTGVIVSPNASLNNMQFTPDGTGIVPFVFGLGGCRTGAGCQSSMAGGVEGETVRPRAFDRTAGPQGNGVVSRSGLFGAEYELADNLSVHWLGLVGRTESLREDNIRFYPVMNGNNVPVIFNDNAYLPASVRQTMVANNIASFQLHKLGSLDPRHDVGLDESSRDVSTMWSWKAGIDYTIPGLDWDLQVSYQKGQSKRNSQMDNMLRYDRLHLATDAVVDPATGNIVCRVQLFDPTPEQLQAAVAGIDSGYPLNPYIPIGTPGNTIPLRSPVGLDNTIEDCVPINIFGSGNMSQEALDYIGTWKASRGYVDQDFAEALVSGELYEGWGAGSINFAFGVTWRDQQFIEGPLPIDVSREGPPRNAPQLGIRSIPAGIQGGSAALHAQSYIPYVGGQTDVWEWFTEVSVPVFESEMLFGQTQRLDTTLAYRASTYDRSGRIASWKLGANFQLVNDIRLRLTRSHDVREANFTELFDNLANLATPADPRFDGQTYSVSQIQGGNRDLKPEEADTIVAGVIWQPTFASWIDGVQVSLDWYQVEIEGAVALLGVQPIVDECELRGVQELCARIERDPTTGRIIRVFNSYLNVAEASTKGVDLEFAYRAEPDFLANQSESFSIRWLSGILQERSNTPFGGSPIDTAGALGSPDLTSLITTTYGFGPWSVQLQGRYIDSTLRNATWVEGVDVDDNSISSMTWWNTRLGYEGELSNGSSYNISFNIQNIFDRDPSIIPGASEFGGGSQTMNPSYDLFGRRFNISANYSF